jgi:RNA polymerase sigma factor (sigma-70 family)
MCHAEQAEHPRFPAGTRPVSEDQHVTTAPHVVARARRRESDAFAALVIEHRPRLLRVARSILRDPHLAEDATQQAFLDMWRAIDKLREPERFEAWSTRILVRTCRREARRRPAWVPETRLSVADTPLAADDYRTVAHREELERGFRQLSADHRTVVVLHHLQDMTLVSVAETLDIPVGTARSRLSRAMGALRVALLIEQGSRPPSW